MKKYLIILFVVLFASWAYSADIERSTYYIYGGVITDSTITGGTIDGITSLDINGDLTVDGNIVARSPILSKGKIYFGTSTAVNNYLSLSESGSFNIGSLGNTWFGVTPAGRVYAPSYSFGNATDAVIIRDVDYNVSIRTGANQNIFRIYNTYTDGSNYERLTLTGVQGASVNLTAETAGTGGDNLDVVVTATGTGHVKLPTENITAGSGTGVTVNSAGHLNRQVYKVTTTYAAYTDTDTKKGIVIATLPAKTKIVGFYADTTTPYTGGTISAATLIVGITAEDAGEILASHDVLSGAVTKGLADADMGTSMTRAAAIQGGYLPSWTGTTAIYATINTTNGNTSALTAGSTTFYIVTERY